MNLKNNKGYVITDISISIIILLILVPIIMGMVFGIESTKRAIDIKTEALNIAVNAVEIRKQIFYDNTLDDSYFITALGGLYQNVSQGDQNSIIIETSKGSYILATIESQVNDTDYINIKVSVLYNIKGEQKEIEIETTFR